jgi:rRNA maturation endonuclease Nob1
MPFCSNCGANIEENHKFCAACGMRVEKTDKTETSSPTTLKQTGSGATPPSPVEVQNNNLPQQSGILRRVDIDKEDIDEVADKAKKSFGAAWNLARKGLSRGAELASQGVSKGAELAGQGIEAAKETIDDRLGQQINNQSKSHHYQAPASQTESQNIKFCPNCGQPVSPGKFCNHCGHKLE